MDIHRLYRLARREEIDYPFLLSALAVYRQPRNKIQAFLRSKELIRVKKGLYIFGDHIRQRPYSKEILANLIYGPSCVSLEYALAFYGLIPERVEVVTSITNNRNKHFSTPIGLFEYYYVATKKFSCDIQLIELTPEKHFLMASKEKALADLLALKSERISTMDSLETHLIENLRIDELTLKQLACDNLAKIAFVYQNHNVNLLVKLLEKLHG